MHCTCRVTFNSCNRLPFRRSNSWEEEEEMVKRTLGGPPYPKELAERLAALEGDPGFQALLEWLKLEEDLLQRKRVWGELDREHDLLVKGALREISIIRRVPETSKKFAEEWRRRESLTAGAAKE